MSSRSGRPRPAGGHCERAIVLDVDVGFQRSAAVDQAKSLSDVKLVCVWRQEIVDEGPVVQADRVNHERISLVMANGFSVPGWFHIRRMRRVQIDAADLMVQLQDHEHLFRALDDEQRPEYPAEQKSGNAAWPAAYPRTETRFACENPFVAFAQGLA